MSDDTDPPLPDTTAAELAGIGAQVYREAPRLSTGADVPPPLPDATAAELAALAAKVYAPRMSTDDDDTVAPPDTTEPDTATETEAEAPPPPPPPPPLGTLNFKAATVRWRLDGPAGSDMDKLVANTISAGFPFEVITPGSAYRIDSASAFLPGMAEALAPYGFNLGIEQPVGGINITVYADEHRTWRRANYLQGADDTAFAFVARAVDARLIVQPAGARRWRITGPALRQAHWLAQVLGKALGDVLVLWQVTADELSREDASVPEVAVRLPDRRITTEFIDRDKDGNLEKVVQTETTPPRKH